MSDNVAEISVDHDLYIARQAIEGLLQSYQNKQAHQFVTRAWREISQIERMAAELYQLAASTQTVREAAE